MSTKNQIVACPPQCPTPAQCELQTGCFEFTGPTTIYSFDASCPWPVYILDEQGNQRPYGTFGGQQVVAERTFDLCATFLICWSKRGTLPLCDVTPPTFHESKPGCTLDPVEPCTGHITGITPKPAEIVSLGDDLCQWSATFPPSDQFEIHIPTCCEGGITVSGEGINFTLVGLQGQIWLPPKQLSCPIEALKITANCDCIADIKIITQK